MNVKFRDLVNPLILNAGWIGFCGDSEYINPNDDIDPVKMGGWSFQGIVPDKYVENIEEKYATFILDDEINECEIYDQDLAFLIWNDNETKLNIVKFHYSENRGEFYE